LWVKTGSRRTLFDHLVGTKQQCIRNRNPNYFRSLVVDQELKFNRINFLASPMFSIGSSAFIERVTALRLPSIFQWPENAEEGALAGYGPRFTDLGRQRARQLIKVLRGAKPADIPVEQPTRFELVINLKTAKAIGHEVPAGLVLRADKLIE
jgi:putative tryptophan/tyrosine transport system substrate-binding protein